MVYQFLRMDSENRLCFIFARLTYMLMYYNDIDDDNENILFDQNKYITNVQ